MDAGRLLILLGIGAAVLYAGRAAASSLPASSGDAWAPTDAGDAGAWQPSAADTWAAQDYAQAPGAPSGASWWESLTGAAPAPVPAGELMNGPAPLANWKVNEYPVYADYIAATEDSYGIPRDLLARLLYQESRYRADIISGRVRSAAGATGIAQFMPATAAQMGVDPLDPYAAISGAAAYLSQLFGMFGNWPHAIQAYNVGPGNLRKILAGSKSMPRETANYLAQISADVPIA